ncbi:coiled-coil domain-containing protein 137 [Hippoglossus hippoglossus]|uniref:coiled-coil domain-containing protein 137 n=1 Tax=Hippoglossus hippoglossus TaxID=8267 RepID=UPI00148E64E6|nr:coiled-coil domain-containing protein 137 [Hippoglossus hippoglossus]XP_035037205.1 coiled-coil domain-containing protein 137 [Hippoglossus stenolepis]
MAKKRGNRSRTAAEPPSDKKLRQDGKPQKAREEDHLEHIPFRLREIMKSKERMKSGPLKSKKLKDAIFPKGKPEESQDGDIPVPHFKRGKHESVKGYLQRMEAETKHVLFLTNNQIDRKPELDADKQEKSGGKSEKKKEYDKGKIQRLQQKKLNRQEAEMEKEMFVDHVPFGEVSMAPPCLSAKPKKAPVKSQNSSKGLLLNSLLGNKVISTVKPSMARKRIVEEERERAVEAYRLLKKRKQQNQEARAASLKNIKDFD